MLRMNQIDQIKDLQQQGLGSREIAGRLNIDRKTAAKYMGEEDFNGQAWVKKAAVSKLDRWQPKIDEWLEEDRRMRRRRRARLLIVLIAALGYHTTPERGCV